MNKQITVSLAALVLGTALVPVPAFAQKAANDGRAGRRLSRQLSGVKRTSHFDRAAAANDPKRT
jgi:hypothetical protein